MTTLYFLYGTMNSSKSAQLLMKNYNYVSEGKKTVVIKPSIDTRDKGYVKSRVLAEKLKAYEIEPTDELKIYNIVADEKPDVVLVDEVQFMTENQIKELAKIVDEFNITVLCYGLMSDFTGHLFEGSKALIENGAKLEHVKTVCVYCNNNANYNMRINDGIPIFEGEQVKVGGNESYKAVCRKCYNDKKINS